jgi:S1-C subfamily serine protease
VYFDPVGDLAVIAVPGLSVAPLTLGPTVAEETDAALQGYPFGGPFTSSAVHVMRVGQAEIDDIYGITSHEREVYTIAADVKQGNSGGPVLTLDGTVAGVVFAKSADTPNVGYAMTMAELNPVAEEAASLTAAVSSGDCLTG